MASPYFSLCDVLLKTMQHTGAEDYDRFFGEFQEQLDPALCSGCGKCTAECWAEARTLAGKTISAGEIMEQVLADRDFYGRDGGLTISGGEPLFQPDFTLALWQLVPFYGNWIIGAILCNCFLNNELQINYSFAGW